MLKIKSFLLVAILMQQKARLQKDVVDRVTKDSKLEMVFLILLCLPNAHRPDTYKASFNRGRTPTGDTNQCLGWADSLGLINYMELMLMVTSVKIVPATYHLT